MNDDLLPRQPIWDLPVRIVHWYLFIAIVVMWWSGEQGQAQIHEWVGYSVLCATVTRISWGFVGGIGARFRAFVVGPKVILNYIRKGGEFAGHNPLGALSVVLMLLCMLIQGSSGLFSTDHILFEGPLASWAGEFSSLFSELHVVNWCFLKLLILLHVLAVIWHQWGRGQPIIQAMWRGQAGHKYTLEPPKSPILALLIFVIWAGVLWLIIYSSPQTQGFY